MNKHAVQCSGWRRRIGGFRFCTPQARSGTRAPSIAPRPTPLPALRPSGGHDQAIPAAVQDSMAARIVCFRFWTPPALALHVLPSTTQTSGRHSPALSSGWTRQVIQHASMQLMAAANRWIPILYATARSATSSFLVLQPPDTIAALRPSRCEQGARQSAYGPGGTLSSRPIGSPRGCPVPHHAHGRPRTKRTEPTHTVWNAFNFDTAHARTPLRSGLDASPVSSPCERSLSDRRCARDRSPGGPARSASERNRPFQASRPTLRPRLSPSFLLRSASAQTPAPLRSPGSRPCTHKSNRLPKTFLGQRCSTRRSDALLQRRTHHTTGLYFRSATARLLPNEVSIERRPRQRPRDVGLASVWGSSAA